MTATFIVFGPSIAVQASECSSEGFGYTLRYRTVQWADRPTRGISRAAGHALKAVVGRAADEGIVGRSKHETVVSRASPRTNPASAPTDRTGPDRTLNRGRRDDPRPRGPGGRRGVGRAADRADVEFFESKVRPVLAGVVRAAATGRRRRRAGSGSTRARRCCGAERAARPVDGRQARREPAPPGGPAATTTTSRRCRPTSRSPPEAVADLAALGRGGGALAGTAAPVRGGPALGVRAGPRRRPAAPCRRRHPDRRLPRGRISRGRASRPPARPTSGR